MVQALTNPAQVSQIIQNDDPELLDATASWLGKELAKGNLTNSQIRNIFSTARQIEARREAGRLEGSDKENQATRREFILLKPKLAYQAARMNNPGVRGLKDWLSAAIDAMVADKQDEDKRFKHFMEFFEAVLAYHYEAEQEKSKQTSHQGGRR